MNLGNHLFQARKKTGLSQEMVAEKLGVSRQTISKWETDETVPDIYQSKKLARLYHLSLDELIEFDVDLKEIEHIIQNTNEEKEAKINWTSAWSKKYPVLATYQQEIQIQRYAQQIREMLNELKNIYGYNHLDSMLVLKDILYQEWKSSKS
ncbi:MAG: helix-turn-helix transcriptional regulator [Coprobacillus sp.]|nr:helix-turn-helix transcriptional regulator [Coprobacillus sp.]